MRTLRRLCLVGVSGLGKTTLVHALAPSMPGYHCLTGSALLRELVGEDFPRFDHFSPERKQHFRQEAIRRMEQIQQSASLHLLCEGHTTLRSRATGVVEPVFTDLDRGFFRELILLDANPALVSARRMADIRRQRPIDDAVVREELAAERAECERLAAVDGLLLHRLDAADPALPAHLRALLEAA